MSWHLVTGEYPPGCGGVGDYTRLLAEALAARGEEVHVWAPGGTSAAGVQVHPDASFHGAGLRTLDDALGGGDPGRVLLVQYAPQAFGRRGANVAFCRWVRRRAGMGDQVRVMFHEPWVPFAPRPRRVALALATRWMAHLLLGAATRSYVSVVAWRDLLRPWAPRGAAEPEWLPIPSTIPPTPAEPAAGGAAVLGHFGTYGEAVARLLEPALAEALLDRPQARALLVGRGSAGFAERFLRRHPDLAGRVETSPASTADEVSRELRRITVALQPYPDGATARRTTLMAMLAHGVAVATHSGRWSEPIWRESGLPLAEDPAGVGALASRLLAEPALRARAAEAGASLYRDRFAMPNTLRVLLADR